MTKKEAEDLLNCWLSTFPEMKEHFNSRPPIRRDKWARYGVVTEEGEGGGLDDDPFKEKRKTRQLYKAVTITGFVRNRATQNAACNCDFQNPVAHLAKEALWNLECAGLGDRLFCFVHESSCTLKKVNCWKGFPKRNHNQQPIKGSPKGTIKFPWSPEKVQRSSLMGVGRFLGVFRSAPSWETEKMI